MNNLHFLREYNLPNVLIIELKRYGNNNNKIHSLVTTPLVDLDLSKYIASISEASRIDGGDGAIIIKLKKL